MSKIAIVGELTAHPGKFDSLLEKFRAHAQASRAEPGCVRFDVAVPKKEPDKLHFYEIWADRQSLDVHANTDRIKAHRDATQDLVAERRITICDLDDSADA